MNPTGLPVVFAALAALAGVASFVASLACLVVLVAGRRQETPLGLSTRGDRTSPEDEDRVLSVHQEALRARQDAIGDQVRDGWPLEIAEGRAAMKVAGLDPDDVEAVMAFNARYGMM